MKLIFGVRQLLEEEYREMKINLTVAFTNLENAYNRITKKNVAGFEEKKN